MKLVASIIVVDNISSEEKQIVENALSLWIGIVNYKPSLFNDFQTYKGDNAIKTADEFLMHGILYCKEEKIRQDFKTALSALGKQKAALSFMIKILSANFNKISDFPCVQFFELYNEMIDLFYTKQALSAEAGEKIFDPEALLSFIIDKMRADKQNSGTGDDEEDDIFA